MPITSTALVKLTHEGTLAQGEEFNWSFWLKPATGATPTMTATQTWITALATYVNASVFNSSVSGSPLALIAEDSAYTLLKAYIYPAGATAATGVVQATVSKSGFGAAELPDQASLVTSLRSDNPGRSGRGRVYLPANGVGLQNHQMFSTDLTNLANVMQAYIQHLNTSSIGTDELDVVVRSLTQGVVRLVSSIVIDSRIDTQRRRANSQAITSTQTRSI